MNQKQIESRQVVRARIRRVYVEEGLYFITAVTRDRRKLFAVASETDRLRQTMRAVRKIHPFGLRAFVFLPDHLHLLLQVGKDTDISRVMQSIKRNYTMNYKLGRGINGRLSLWQRGFWDHVIRDEPDFRNHLDYIHYNPVKHGYVDKPEDYLHSSFLEYVKRGWYEIGWGHKEPENIEALQISEP